MSSFDIVPLDPVLDVVDADVALDVVAAVEDELALVALAASLDGGGGGGICDID